MRLSTLFTKTSRDYPADETSKNAQLLIQGGFVHKAMAGVYAYLPLGLMVLNKIENIVRKNMNAIGGQEILMNSLHPKEWWEITDRWDAEKVDVLFRLDSQTKSQYALACSHEEQVTPIAKLYLNSYRDLPDFDPEHNIFPVTIYQIQTKFRDELRSKSGIMRGREFRMKDMYDFHTSQISADKYYELVKQTYFKIYTEIGLKAYAVHAGGGMFTTNDSHEFQVICEAGEDQIYYNDEGIAYNSEIIEVLKQNGQTISSDLKTAKSAEVGNIFKLGDKYSQAFDLKIATKDNSQIIPVMNCHGIGTSRCMGVIAEIYSDEKGLKWPKSVAPFMTHLVVNINEKDDENVKTQIQILAEQIYTGELILNDENNDFRLIKSPAKVADQVLYDDRVGLNMGAKLTDAELIGCPYILILSKRSLENGGVELKIRATGESKILEI